MLMFFTDPILRAPTIGCMLMGLSAAIVGVIAFVRRRSLLGETLSHATYPGVILALLVASILGMASLTSVVVVTGGAFISAFLGLLLMDWLETRNKVPQDAALCFVLALFFGVGLTIASRIQFTHPTVYRQVEAYLYGQAATLTDGYLLLYGGLSMVVIGTVLLIYKELQASSFDREFALASGINIRIVNLLTFVLMVLAVVMGIRSVGVVLMSALLIAPPIAARQFTNNLSKMFILSGLFGLLSGYLGNVFAVVGSDVFSLSLPSGPIIVLVASLLCFFALLFAPKRGVLIRHLRVLAFRYRCLQENLLKAIWRHGKETGLTLAQIAAKQSVARIYLYFLLGQLIRSGWLTKEGRHYLLTVDGQQRAARIVRLHRLWEVYLVEYVGLGEKRVHHNAEEMEHILTPTLEEKLTELLDDPKKDPHAQPIPPRSAWA